MTKEGETVALNGGPAGKLRREQAKVFKDKKQGKEDAKTRYKPEKVPLKESAKSVASMKSTREKSAGRCSKCNQLHHNARVCLMPAMPKQS